MVKALYIIPAGLVAFVAMGTAASAAEHQVPLVMAQAQNGNAAAPPAGAPPVVNPPMGPKAAASDDDDDSEENDVFDPTRARNPVAPVEENSANEIDRGS